MSHSKTVQPHGGTTAVLPRLGTMAANLRRVTEVMLDEEYGDGFLRPTRAAFETTWSLLVEAEEAVPTGLPLASPATVGDGGLLIEWKRDDRSVFLAVPADPGEGYIYMRSPGHRQTLRELTGPALASAVEWLTKQ